MSKTKELKGLKVKLTSILDSVDTIISQDLKKLKKEYQQKILEEKTQLLIKIAEGENLDLNLLKSKYLKSKELHIMEESIPLLTDTEELLDRIIVNENTYYYENKEKGKVYDTSNKEVGYYKNNNIILN